MKLFLVLIFCLLLTGCNKQEETFIKNPVIYDNILLTDEMKEMANDLSLMQDDTMLVYKGSVSHNLDLNQDGEKEVILYEQGYFTENDEYHFGKLLINDKDYSSFIDDMYDVSDSFAIGKIENQFFLLINSELEDDYTDTRIFIYDEELKCVLESLEGSKRGTPFLYDNLLHTKKHTDVLGSALIDETYEWNGSEFIKIIPDDGLYSYDLYKGKKLKITDELVVYKDRNFEESVILPVGTEFTSDKTDGEYWSNILVNDEEYWFFNDFSDISFFNKIEGLFFAG